MTKPPLYWKLKRLLDELESILWSDALHDMLASLPFAEQEKIYNHRLFKRAGVQLLP